MKAKWILITLTLLVLVSVGAAVAQAPTMSVIELPINQKVTVRCQGGDELIATVWGGGEWVLECRQYVTVKNGTRD